MDREEEVCLHSRRFSWVLLVLPCSVGYRLVKLFPMYFIYTQAMLNTALPSSTNKIHLQLVKTT